MTYRERLNREFLIADTFHKWIEGMELLQEDEIHKMSAELLDLIQRDIAEEAERFTVKVEPLYNVGSRKTVEIKMEEEIKILSGMVTAYRDAIRILKDKE